MFLRSIAVTVALAAGLAVILGMAFIICIPAYCIGRLQGQPRGFGPAFSGGKLSR